MRRAPAIFRRHLDGRKIEGAVEIALELHPELLQQAINEGLRPDPRLLLNVILQALAGLGHARLVRGESDALDQPALASWPIPERVS